jgi:hypothetical protein
MQHVSQPNSIWMDENMDEKMCGGYGGGLS